MEGKRRDPSVFSPLSRQRYVCVSAIGCFPDRWNRRWFVLRDNVLMYFRKRCLLKSDTHNSKRIPTLSHSAPCAAEAPRDFLGFRDKPNGVVLLDEANVR